MVTGMKVVGCCALWSASSNTVVIAGQYLPEKAAQ
jgi:hypothetical protein